MKRMAGYYGSNDDARPDNAAADGALASGTARCVGVYV